MRTPAENEAFVREHWEQVTAEWGRVLPGRFTQTFHLTLPVIWCGTLSVMFAKTPEEAWAAAAELTEQRLKDVRKVEIEIALLRGLLYLLSAEPGDMTSPIWERILAREQTALAYLKKRMRP